ncbi:MAG: GNAT family N-acetyltransferase, partial [Hymenobacter sp.]|nr:GNAT family N-acetyltransferase [Hymenobacter sp.]
GVGIALLPAEQRRGYAGAALQLLVRHARQTLHLHQLHCTITAGNVASQRLFERVGFQQIGERKDWLRTAEGWQNVVEYQYIVGVGQP